MTNPRVRSALAGCALAMIAAPALAAPGRLGGGGDLGVSLGRIVASLIICIFVALLAALLIRQRAGKSDLRAFFARLEPRGRAIHVVETRRLSPHADICLVRSGGQEYLLLLMAGSAQVLREGPALSDEDVRERES